MGFTLVKTNRFEKDIKSIIKRGYDITLIEKVIDDYLIIGKPLPAIYKDHKLYGDYEGNRECHITPDWLLVYRIYEDSLFLQLTRTGSHSDLFR